MGSEGTGIVLNRCSGEMIKPEARKSSIQIQRELSSPTRQKRRQIEKELESTIELGVGRITRKPNVKVAYCL